MTDVHTLETYPTVRLHNVRHLDDPEWTTDCDGERARAFRETLARAVRECDRGRVRLVDGRDVLNGPGLTADLLHPGDAGMEAIGRGLAAELTDALAE